VNVTNGKVIRLLVDDELFDLRYGRLRHHERTLDFRAGLLRRQVEWRSRSAAAPNRGTSAQSEWEWAAQLCEAKAGRSSTTLTAQPAPQDPCTAGDPRRRIQGGTKRPEI
jgi:hypothetical protein